MTWGILASSLWRLLLPHLFIKPRCGNRSIVGRNRSVIEGEVVVELALALANTLSRPIDWRAQKYLGSELANRVIIVHSLEALGLVRVRYLRTCSWDVANCRMCVVWSSSSKGRCSLYINFLITLYLRIGGRGEVVVKLWRGATGYIYMHE